jgi:superfamily II DNA/RNA helicase
LLSTFADLGVPAAVISRLAEAGITSPFPIQSAVLPAALTGQDVCGRAPTGSGKTLAFGIPTVLRVDRAKPGRPRALILVPTRELAAQIERDLTPLAAAHKRRVVALYGGVGFDRQLRSLRRGVDIVVACPGRLTDLIDRGQVSLGDVDVVVIDEADRMADMGFLPVVRRLLDATPATRQTLLFSATLDGEVDVLVARYQRDPLRVDVTPPESAGADPREHLFWRVARGQRAALTARIVAGGSSTVVFCRTKRGADRLARQLTQSGLSVAAIHGDRSQAQREKALAAFSARKVQALVATDVAARGIHVDAVGCVVHFDPADDDKAYLHRSGRTGRAGAGGTVVSLVEDHHVGPVKLLQRRLGFPAGATDPDLRGFGGGVFVPARPEKPEAPVAKRHPRKTTSGPPRRTRSRAAAGRRC